ncbi:aldehyde dehydrogenase family protein [Winogradskyella sp. 3972H.M.0a.05]|uniref:aldehyde dehydrogenase n=1 Tax=Winogradskyella sp. 3972H.M.0a.05 TaxID=2950277 RepID=UPI0033944F03
MNYDALLESQRNFFLSQGTKSLKFRKEQLKTLKRLLKDNESRLHEAIYKDFKKSETENYLTELYLIYHEIDNAIKNLDQWARKERVSTNFFNFPARSYILKEPLGVTLVIGAWNYPYNLCFIPSIASIAAGNTVILKPSELPSNTSALMAELINSNFDKGFFHVIEGGVPETTALLEQRFDKIFFTGSPKVGQIIYQAAAKHLTPVTLELGGKNPTFFHKDANLSMGIKRMVWAKFLNSGQTCVAPDYILVHEDIKEKFLKKLVAEIEKHNYSIDRGNFLQIINDHNLKRLQSMLTNDNVYYGGNVNEGERYIEPTVLYPVNLDDAVMQEEIFGPILPVLTYRNLDEAIAITRRYEKPLSCYVFSGSRSVKRRILSEISFGCGSINESIMNYSNDKLPFGGVGHSGFGSYHGKFGFDTFSHQKAMLEKPNWLELNLKYYKYTKTKLNIIKRLFFSGIRY